MAEPIIYPFRAEGHGDVVAALSSMTAAVRESARAMDALGKAGQAAGRQTQRGAATGRAGLTELQRIALRVAADQEKAAKRASAAQEREALRAVAAANRAGKAQEKAALQAAKAQERAYEYVYRLKQRYLEKEERDAERSAKKIAQTQMRAREANLREHAGFGGRVFDRGVGAIGRLAYSALSTGAGMIGGAARESLETQNIANRVSINARMSGQAGADPTQLRKEFERTAMATPGQSAADIGRATQAYVDLTGDLTTARSSMQTFATVASATGAAVEDVATAAASLGSKFDVKKVEDMQKVFATLVFQGKGGAMTMKDLASQFQKLASAANAFDIGKGPEAVAKLGGLVQIARTGTRSPQQAGTAVENIFTGLTGHQKQLKAAGVDLYDKKGGKRDINEVLAETIAKVGGSDMGAKSAGLLKIFGKQGSRAVNPLMATAIEASHGMSGQQAQQAATSAVLAALNQAAQASSNYAEVEQDAAQAQRSVSVQLVAAWETLKAVAGDRLAPALAELVGRLASDGKALDLFIAAVGLAADGLTALTELLQKLGLVSGGTVEDKAEAANKKDFDLGKRRDALEREVHAFGDPTKLEGDKLDKYKAKKAEYDKTEAEYSTAHEEAKKLNADAQKQKDTLKAISDAASPEDAAAIANKAYHDAGANGRGAGDTSRWVNHLIGEGDSDALASADGENPEQRAIRHATVQREAADSGGGADKMGEAADKHASAAAKFSGILDKLAAVVGTLGGGTIGGSKPRLPGV